MERLAILFLTFLLTSLISSVHSQDTTFITGQTITTNLIWTKSNSPYVISGDVIVKNSATLTVEPGVEVLIRPDQDNNPQSLFGNPDKVCIGADDPLGAIFAIGTEAEPISFKSLSSSPSSSDWTGLFTMGPKSHFEYVEISDAEIGINGMYTDNSDTLKVLHCIFSNLSSDGIDWGGNGGIAIVKYNLFQNINTGLNLNGAPVGLVEYNTFKLNNYGIACKMNSKVTFTGNEIYSNFVGIWIYHDLTSSASLLFRNNNIYSNSSYEVSNESSFEADFKGNYWGAGVTSQMNTGSNPKNISSLNDFFDNNSMGLINYSHWLDAPWPGGNPTGSYNSAHILPMDISYSTERFNYSSEESLTVQLTDPDLNTNSNLAETVSIQSWSEKETIKEDLLLSETGINTGVFRGGIELDPDGAVSADGVLQAVLGEWMYVEYNDPANDWGNPEIFSRELLYGGTVSQAQTIDAPIVFYKSKEPYLVMGTHLINAGSLTIEPGTRVFVKGKDFINMFGGSFNASGTAQDSIYIIFDSKNPGWDGFLFAGQAIIDYCHIEDCGIINMPYSGMSISNSYVKNCTIGIQLEQNTLVENNYLDNCPILSNIIFTPIIRNNTIINNEEYGINVSNGSRPQIMNNTILNSNIGIGIHSDALPTIKNNTITDNNTGIYFDDNDAFPVTQINYNNIYDNTGWNIKNGTAITNAQFNYWGSDMLSEISSGVNPKNLDKLYDKYDVPGLEYINYSHWLDAPWPGGSPHASGFSGELELRRSDDSPGSHFKQGEQVKIWLRDNDENENADFQDTSIVYAWSELEKNPEVVNLIETGDSTGEFTALLDFNPDTGIPSANGMLEIDNNNSFWVSYNDSLDDWNSISSVYDSAMYNIQLAEYKNDQNTVLLLHLNEGTGQSAADLSGNLNQGQLGNSTGTDENDPIWSNEGILNNCLYFPGENNSIASYLKIPSSATLDNISNEITIEMWVKFPSSTPNDWFLGKGSQVGTRIWGLFYSNGLRLNGLLQINGSERGENDAMWTETELNLNEWKHIAYTFDGSQMRFYMDYELVGVNSESGTLSWENNYDLFLGGNWEGLENAEMYMDEVRISNIARTNFSTEPEIPPAKIKNLSVVDSGYYSITLNWNTPGDDQYTGTCEIYDLRMSTSPIDSANFHDADSVPGLPLPLTAGSLQIYEIENLQSGNTFYFALKARDDEGKWSPISNIAVGETPPRYFTDERDGQEYKMQQIGYQTWMAENLNYYTPEGSWYYDNDSLSYADSLGRIYDWGTAMAKDQSFNSVLLQPIYPTQGVCPVDWHIPTDADWRVLEEELGMAGAQTLLIGYRGTKEGDKLKYDSISGFDALPYGFRNEVGDFTLIDSSYYFWTASELDANKSMFRQLDTARSDIYREANNKLAGMAVRCVKDIAQISIQISKSDVSKVNGSDGSIDATTAGGISPYTFNWSNGDVEEDLMSLEPGTYILTVTDLRDSTAIDSITILETFTDPRDNQKYRVVRLDERVWMAENLNFNSSGSIYYENDSLANHHNGRLYTWQTAMNACPSTWYLPTDEEWQDLEIFLGMNPGVAEGTDWRGTDEGDKLKNSGSAGFNAIMAGQYDGALFVGLDNLTHFWTGTESGTDALNRKLDNIHSNIERSLMDKSNAYSVRCILDTCALIDIEATVTNITCFGENNGSIKLSVSGRKEPYSYNWSNGADSNLISGLSSGYLRITVSDAVGCSKTDSIIISEPPLLTTEITDSSNISCNGFSDGMAVVTPQGGTFPYEYRWDDISKTRDSILTGMSADRYYYVNITDANGCNIIDSVQLSQPGSLDLGINEQYQICQDQSLDIVTSQEFSVYNWSTGDTTNLLSVNTPGTYTLTVTDSNGCPGYATTAVYQDFIYQGEEICLVTVGSAGKNVVVWEKAEGQDISKYNLYREGIDFGTYDYLGSVPHESLSIFVDPDSDPRKKSYKYKITAVNSCGTESDLSFYHKSIHLQISLAIQGYNLNWVDYEYEAGGLRFIRYEIYRGTGVNDLQLVDAVSSSENSYTDRDAPDGLLYYQIAGLLSSPCSPVGNRKSTEESYEYSFSNFEDNGQGTGLNSVLENKLILYPNPATNEVRIDFPNPENRKCFINLIDLGGRSISSEGPVKGNQTILNLNDVPKGVYIIEVWADKIYREKLIIE